MSLFSKRLVTIAVSVTVLSASHGASFAGSKEDAIRAAVIYNISRFTVWEDSRFDSPSDPVVLCVSSSDPMAASLQAMDGKPVGGRRIQVRRTSHIDRACHMAYVTQAASGPDYLNSLRDRGVLTIGESPGFVDAGAIQLITIGRQIRFEINQKVAERAGAHLSSNLLRLAVSVR